MNAEPLTVCFALGLGDTYWACTKLKAMRLAFGRPIHGYVNASPNHNTVKMLELIPYLDKVGFSNDAPYDILHELDGGHRDGRWSSVEGSAGWHGFDYVMVPNGHLERGESLDSWFPTLATEHCVPFRVSTTARLAVRAKFPDRPFLLYPSGTGPNHGFHRDTWTTRDWVRVIELLNEAGITPVMVGANTPDDKSYMSDIKYHGKHTRFLDKVGRTSTEEYVAVLQEAAVWVGLNSGGGIIAGAQGTPTVMLWSDDAHPIVDVSVQLHTNMRTSWLPPGHEHWYRTLSFGSPELTPQNVVDAALGVTR